MLFPVHVATNQPSCADFFSSFDSQFAFFLLLFLERVPVHLTSLSFPSLPLPLSSLNLLFFHSLPPSSLSPPVQISSFDSSFQVHQRTHLPLLPLHPVL